jgi:outer membrane protein OmpA-like peptidoglycan-associated protein
MKLASAIMKFLSASLLVTAAICIARADGLVKNLGGMQPNVKVIEDALGEQKLKVRGVEKKVVGAASFDQITFDFNSANLTPAAKEFLDVVGEALAGEKLSGFTYEVEGHTDAKGSEGYNMALSRRRAESVQSYLVSRAGIDPARLVVTPVGESDLLYPDDPENPRNRRVVLRGVTGN